ncbi:CcdB family protein [Sphingobium boeckii]|uniref:Toxin CcdB n=1 Tax=Sphingobium boeckii TaxID=1082345 RepID=A0A7W9AGG2_9SPHN|nr:CcdB family protein [Sphingobium boeckii]MBB5685046.1 toxin CcdB [Sphingobium boeckii]
MAKFDVYRMSGGSGYLIDCQADLLKGLNSCFVVPLLPIDHAPKAADRLNPIFQIGGESCVMVTQFAAAVSVRELGERIGSLIDQDTKIMNALDMLLSGY